MKEIKKFVNDNSYFELDNEEETLLAFATRKHGSIFNDAYGPEDLKEAEMLKQKLLKEFVDIDVEIDTCDEWVNLIVTLK